MASLEDILRLEDWDTYEGHAIEDEKPLLSPSLDVKDDLEAALSGDFSFNGTFAHSNSYADAPNPCMDLERVGLLGLPFSEIQSKTIIAAFPDIVEDEGTWTIPGEKIRFHNPGWDTWIKNTVVTSLNTALSASVANPVLLTRLKSLVIHSKHAESKSYHHDVHEDSRTYAFLSVILPSPHSGGQLQLRHKETTKTFSTSGASFMSSIAVGAYDSVSQIVTPVESGYLVYLSYELSVLGEAYAIPRLPQLDGASARLQQVFRSWRQALDTTSDADEVDEDSSTPSLLLLKLNHKYEVKSLNFKATSLEGSDRLQLSYIAPLAKAYGFNLHLAAAKYVEHGFFTIESSGYGGWGGRGCFGRYGRSRYDRYGDYDDDDDEWSEIDEGDLEMDEIEERTFTLSPVKALDGTPMRCIHSDLDEESEDPACEHLFINGPLTDEERETNFSRDDRESGSLTYAWETCVLVITPAERAGQDFEEGDTHMFACSALSTSLSESPTPKEKKLTTTLLTWIRGRKPSDMTALKNAATVLRNSADRWNDADLFVQACQACGPDRCISLIGVDGLVSAYQAFDWKGIRTLYTDALSAEPSNQLRAKVLEGILATATEQGDADVISWCNTQRTLVLDTLQKLEASEVDWVVNLIQSKPNPTLFLRDIFFPRLHVVKLEVPVWTALLSRLQVVSQTESVFDRAALVELTKSTLVRLGNDLGPTPVRNANTPSYLSSSVETNFVESIMSFVRICERFEAFDACDSLFARMYAARVQYDAANTPQSASRYYSILCSRMVAFIQEKPAIKPRLTTFFGHVTDVLLPSITTSDNQVFRSALQNTADPITTLSQCLTPERIKEMALRPASLKSLSEYVATTLRPMAMTEDSKAALGRILAFCLQGILNSFSLQSLETTSSSYTSYGYGRDIQTVSGVELLKLCFTLGLPTFAERVLGKFLTIPKSNEPKYIKLGLVTFLRTLPAIVEPYKKSLTVAPFSIFAGEVVKKFVRHILGAKPNATVGVQELRTVGCGCMECNRWLVPFLVGKDVQTSVREKQKVRTHLETRLSKARGWGVTWTTIRVGSPHTLQIIKPRHMVAVGEWAGNQKEAAMVIALLGDIQQQKAILGADYNWVAGTIAGTAVPPPLAAAPAKRQSDATTEQTAKKPRTT